MERPGTARTSTKNPTSPLAKTNVVNDAYLPVQGLSFAQRKAHSLRSSKSSIVEGSDLMRNIDRPPPGDPTMNRRKSQANPGLSKRTSAYYENEFAVGRESNSALDRVRNEALVIAELKTNVIVRTYSPIYLPILPIDLVRFLLVRNVLADTHPR